MKGSRWKEREFFRIDYLDSVLETDGALKACITLGNKC